MSAEDVLEALARAIRKGSGASKYQADLLAGQMLPHLPAFMVGPRGAVTDAERAAINGALIEALPLWVDTIEEDHARRALLGSIVTALEAAARVSPETDS